MLYILDEGKSLKIIVLEVLCIYVYIIYIYLIFNAKYLLFLVDIEENVFNVKNKRT